MKLLLPVEALWKRSLVYDFIFIWLNQRASFHHGLCTPIPGV